MQYPHQAGSTTNRGCLTRSWPLVSASDILCGRRCVAGREVARLAPQVSDGSRSFPSATRSETQGYPRRSLAPQPPCVPVGGYCRVSPPVWQEGDSRGRARASSVEGGETRLGWRPPSRGGPVAAVEEWDGEISGPTPPESPLSRSPVLPRMRYLADFAGRKRPLAAPSPTASRRRTPQNGVARSPECGITPAAAAPRLATWRGATFQAPLPQPNEAQPQTKYRRDTARRYRCPRQPCRMRRSARARPDGET